MSGSQVFSSEMFLGFCEEICMNGEIFGLKMLGSKYYCTSCLLLCDWKCYTLFSYLMHYTASTKGNHFKTLSYQETFLNTKRLLFLLPRKQIVKHRNTTITKISWTWHAVAYSALFNNISANRDAQGLLIFIMCAWRGKAARLIYVLNISFLEGKPSSAEFKLIRSFISSRPGVRVNY